MPSLFNKDSIDSSPWPYAEFAKGGQLFWGAGELHAANRLATRGVAKRLLGWFGGKPPRGNFLNRAMWCVLEHIFINFLL